VELIFFIADDDFNNDAPQLSWTCVDVNDLTSKSSCCKASFILLNKSVDAQVLSRLVIFKVGTSEKEKSLREREQKRKVKSVERERGVQKRIEGTE